MNSFGDYLKKVRIEKGFRTQKDLSDASKISQATLSRIEAGTQKPQLDTLRVLAKVLNLTYSRILKESGNYDLSDMETATHIFKGDELNHEETELWLKSINPSIISIPVVTKVDMFNGGLENSKYVVDRLYYEKFIFNGKYGFGLQVQDDSMSGDGIFNRDTVLATVESNLPSSNDLTILNVNDNSETLIRRVVYQSDLFILTSSNSKFKTLVLPKDQVNIIGKVIQINRKIN